MVLVGYTTCHPTSTANISVHGQNRAHGFPIFQSPASTPQGLCCGIVFRRPCDLDFELIERPYNTCRRTCCRFGISRLSRFHKPVVEDIRTFLDRRRVRDRAVGSFWLVGVVLVDSIAGDVVGKIESSPTHPGSSNCRLNFVHTNSVSHVFAIRRHLILGLVARSIQVQSLDPSRQNGYNIIRCLRRGSSVGRAAD